MQAIHKIVVMFSLLIFCSLAYAENPSDWDIIGVRLGDKIDKIQVLVAMANKNLKLEEKKDTFLRVNLI